MKNRQKITYENIKYVSDNKLRQMVCSYKDWCKKNNYSLKNMNMYFPLEQKIRIVMEEYDKRNKGE